MEFLNKAQLNIVSGANGGGNYESFNSPKNYDGYTTYGGQGGGFVGTNGCGMDLGTVIDNNKCLVGVIAGAFAGAGSINGKRRNCRGDWRSVFIIR